MSAHPMPQPLTDEEKERLKLLGEKEIGKMTGDEFFELADLKARARLTS